MTWMLQVGQNKGTKCKGVIPGISEDRGLRFHKYEDRRYDTLKCEEVKTQEYQTNLD